MRYRALRDRALVPLLPLALSAGIACSEGGPAGPGEPDPADDNAAEPQVSSVHIEPVEDDFVIVGAAIQLSATVRDAHGTELPRAASWTTLDPDLVAIGADGRLSVLRAGAARVVATAEAASDTLVLDCLPRLEVSHDTATVRPGEQLQLVATLVGASSPEPPQGAVSWSTSDGAVAEVSDGGMVLAKDLGEAAVRATYGSQVADVGITVYRPQFVSVSAGAMHSCGLLAEGTAWCWGANGHGELGNGTKQHTSAPTPSAMGYEFRSIVAAGGFSCGVGTDDMGYCWGDDSMMELGSPHRVRHATTPLAVHGDMPFQSISGSFMAHACGLTMSGEAWCWGYNRFGMIGHGSVVDELLPVPTMGGHTFAKLNSSFFRTCAVDMSGRLYCWGRGGAVQVGDPSFDPEVCSGQPCATQPRAAQSEVRFQEVSVGRLHTCALSEEGQAYCWGEGEDGQLGTQTFDDLAVPTPILSDDRFVDVSVGRDHSCALTVDGRAQCWGDNEDGQLGDGTRISTAGPVDVATELRFTGISAGYMHTCAVTGNGEAYCWGANGMGQLGDASMNDSLTPTRVALD